MAPPIGTNLISLLRFPDSLEAKRAGHYPLKEKLRDAKVPTERAAESAALKARAGLPANEGFEVSALLWLGRDEPELGKRDDLVWEVRFFKAHSITGLLWINATTGTVKVLMDPRQK